MCKGTAIIISPLLALMADQVYSLEQKGISCLTINSQLGVKAKRAAFQKLRAGGVKLLFLAPETLLKQEIIDLINDELDISFIAVDESHIVSLWGMSFRPAYKDLSKIKSLFKPVPVVALTATADPVTLKDILDVLKLHNAKTFIHGMDRSNISYIVKPKTSEFLQCLSIIKSYPPDTCGIIYCSSRERTETLEAYLRKNNIESRAFHAGLPVAEKREIQTAYTEKTLNIIVATVAFGMGIDRSDVRFVINMDIPNSIEEFAQMSGRASRDGAPATSYILYSSSDVSKNAWLLKVSKPRPIAARLAITVDKLKAMQKLCISTKTCRRKTLTSYFGDYSTPDNCNNCDICNSSFKQTGYVPA